MQKNYEKQKTSNLGPKYLIEVFWVVSLKNLYHIRSQHPRICQNAKFCAKSKIPNWYQKMPDLVVFKLQF